MDQSNPRRVGRPKKQTSHPVADENQVVGVATDFLTPKEIASRTRISARTVLNMIHAGVLPAQRHGRLKYFVLLADAQKHFPGIDFTSV